MRGDPETLLAFLRSCSHRLGLPDTAVAATPVPTEVQEVLRSSLQEAQGVEVGALSVDLDFLETSSAFDKRKFIVFFSYTLMRDLCFESESPCRYDSTPSSRIYCSRVPIALGTVPPAFLRCQVLETLELPEDSEEMKTELARRWETKFCKGRAGWAMG